MSTLADPTAIAQELIENSSLCLIFSPPLGKAIKKLGIPHPAEATILINQIAFCMDNKYGKVTTDGRRWIYNSYAQWVAEQFTTLSEWQFGVVVRDLVDTGIIEKTEYADLRHSLKKAVPGWHPGKRTTWIRVNVERLLELTGCLPHSWANRLEALPDAKIANTTKLNCDDNDAQLRSQLCTIYKKTSISRQDYAEANLREKDGENLDEENESCEQPDKYGYWNEEPPINTHYVVEHETEPLVGNTDCFLGQCSAAPPSENFHADDKCNSVPEVRFKKKSESSGKLETKKQLWEIAPKQPYAVFLNWWADRKYKPQGGKWEVAATSNAYSEFYKDCDRTTVAIFPEFLEYMRTVAENCNQQLANGIKAILPSCFISKPEATNENVKQVMVNIQKLVNDGATVALPSNAATPACSESMSFDSAANAGIIQPLREFAAIAGTEAEMQTITDDELLRILQIKQTTWKNAPRLRDSIKRWVENTVGVMMCETGPVLEI